MPINVPDNPKVYTTTYDNFKGVDFTNDATNVWRRRSPTGVNMLPDESGRPFKRHGWDILLSNENLCTALDVDACGINKCSYFELAGVDHIVVFTDNGVVFYNGDENANVNGVQGVTAVNKDYDCYSGFDRSFFFEGNGTSAFYIYGNYRVWRYESDFALHEVTDIVTRPTLLIGTSADGVGTFYEGYNLLGRNGAIEYNDTTLYTWWASDGLTISVDDSFKTTYTKGAQPLYRWKWESGSWTTISGGVSFPSSIKVSGTPQEDDEIIVLWTNGVLLPNNVAQDDIPNMKVFGSIGRQFDYEVPIKAFNIALQEKECRLFTDDTNHREKKRAWIEFKEAWTEKVAGEDFIRAEFPTVDITITPFEDEDSTTTTASLVGA